MVLLVMKSPNPQLPSNFIGQNYDIALNNLIQALSDSPNSEKLSSLSSKFKELLQCRADPPLETIWFYSALRFRAPENEPFKRVAAAKDLFQLIASCSASCSPFKSIALIAPVIYNVFGLVADFKGFELKTKKEKKFAREVKGLVDSILGFINVCCEGVDGKFDVSDVLVVPLGKLVDVWILDKGNVDGGCVGAFFPLLSDRVVERISGEGCELSELAGCVTAEALLLKMCLWVLEGGSSKEMQDELRAWTVASITGFRNPCFFEILMVMLLEPSLPIASLLNSDDESCLRKILYDAVVLVEYSFLKPEQMQQLPAKLLKDILMAKLLVSCEAIELHRKQKDQMRVISYTNAFSSSSFPSLLIKWIRSEMGAGDEASEPSSSTPTALLRWIFEIEKSGIRIFNDDLLKTQAKLLLDSTTEGFKPPVPRDGRKKSDSDLLFYIDNKGEEVEEEGDEKVTESTSAAFVAAARTMQSVEPDNKKRKGKDSEQKSSVKFLKYSLDENSGSREGRSSIAHNNDSSSESEVDNPSTDEE